MNETQVASEQVESAADRFHRHLIHCEICRIEKNHCGEGYRLLVEAMKELKSHY